MRTTTYLNCAHKYGINSGLFEVRPVIYTCIRIILEDIYAKDPLSSFGFIGSNTTHYLENGNIKKLDEIKTEDKNNTRRYRIYKRIMLTFFSPDQFEHIYNEEFSSYVIIRKRQIESNPNIIDDISTYFSENYTNFG